MHTKRNFEQKLKKLDFLFLCFTTNFFLFLLNSIFPLIAGLLLDFIYIVRVSLKKVKFFNKKWQAEGRPDFSYILPAKSDRFFACNFSPIHEISLIWAFFKRFIPSAWVSYKGYLWLSSKTERSIWYAGIIVFCKSITYIGLISNYYQTLF